MYRVSGQNKSLIDWIIENGGATLVELFAGGIKACANDPNLGNCLLAVVDIASLGVAALKAYEVGRAIWRIVSVAGKFVEDANRFRQVLQRGRSIIAEAKVNCFPAGTLVATPDGDRPAGRQPSRSHRDYRGLDADRCLQLRGRLLGKFKPRSEEIYRIADGGGVPWLGEIRDLDNPDVWYDSRWAYHDVVIKDGRVFDATTGRYGLPLEEYRQKFRYGEYFNFNQFPVGCCRRRRNR
jgi:hypothetical protein